MTPPPDDVRSREGDRTECGGGKEDAPQTPSSDFGEAPSVAPGQAERRARELLSSRSKPTVGPAVLQWEIKFPRLYLLFIALNIMDLLVTVAVMNQAGMIEANPWARLILFHFGLRGFLLYKLALTTMVIVLAEIIARHRPRTAMALMVFGCTALGMVVLYGGMHLFRALLSSRPMLR